LIGTLRKYLIGKMLAYKLLQN